MPPTLSESAHELRRSAAVIPALLMVALFVTLAAADGGYFATAFLPATLFAVALLGVALVSVSTRSLVPPAVVAAVALLAAYAAWSYLSILWSTDQGAAWEGANRALLYAVTFALFALWPLRPLSATAVLGAFGLGVAGLGLVTLLQAAASDEVSSMFAYGRFFAPIGYTNGNAALCSLGLLACVFLATRREVPAPLRGLALGGAGLLAGLALLAQSRGWAISLPLALLAMVAIVPGRARTIVVIALVAAAVAPAVEPILDVLDGFTDGRALEPLMSSASTAIFTSAGLLAVVGTGLAFLDRRVQAGHRVSRVARAGTATVAALACVLGLVAVLVAVDDPFGGASAAWSDFRAGAEADEEEAGSRFTSAGGQNRWDYWDVGLSQFAASPLTGEGSGNFQNAYLREGESAQRPRFPHSLQVRLLAETGVVGAVVFLGALVAALIAASRAVRRGPQLASAAAGTGVVIFLYWLIHGSAEWFYELPALATPAFGMLGLATALAPRRTALEGRRERARTLVRGRAGVGALVLAGLAGACVLAAPWISARQVDEAVEIWRTDPAAAFDRLDSAARFDPLSVEPHSAAAAIAIRLGRDQRARSELEAVLAADPEDAFAHLELGALASSRGDRRAATARLAQAAELSPNDPLIEDARETVRSGERLDPAEVYDAVLARRSSLTSPR